jgi:hypothetical protein
MFSEEGLAAVRIAATLTHMYGALRIRIRGGDRLFAEVAWPPAPRPPDGAAAIHPCAFRTSVAELWSEAREGRHAAVDHEPSVGLGVAPGGVVHPSGIAKIPVQDRFVYAFGATLDPDQCHEIAEELARTLEPGAGVLGLGLRGDADTEVTVTYVDTAPESVLSPEDEQAVIDVLEQLMARYAVVQLLDRVQAPPTDRLSSE